MEIDLAGKSAVVTGGAAGIGRACAFALAGAGARIAVVDLNLAGAQETIDAIGDGLAIACDLSDAAAVVDMRRRVSEGMGSVDILVNCAGVISYRRGIEAVSVAEWDTVLDVNLRGTFLVCRAFMEGMKARGGKVIVFSSLAARVGGIEVGVHYAASKAGLIGLTRTLAKEGGPFGVNVNAVAPGIILTDPVRRQIGGREAEYAAQIPLRRVGSPEDVANVVLFLASPLADYVTGVTLDVNGGMYMG
ncbi:MAG: SDR family oxidoreductase [Anaerolineae bacterium]|nr:SDR family oxidoreductase [Anaerolineae bacterium]